MLHPNLLDDERIRRRALAARVNLMAQSLAEAKDGGRELGVPPPPILTPKTCREWAERLQAANGFEATDL